MGYLFYKLAATKGSANGMFNIASRLVENSGLNQNYDEAAFYLH